MGRQIMRGHSSSVYGKTTAKRNAYSECTGNSLSWYVPGAWLKTLRHAMRSLSYQHFSTAKCCGPEGWDDILVLRRSNRGTSRCLSGRYDARRAGGKAKSESRNKRNNRPRRKGNRLELSTLRLMPKQ